MDRILGLITEPSSKLSIAPQLRKPWTRDSVTFLSHRITWSSYRLRSNGRAWGWTLMQWGKSRRQKTEINLGAGDIPEPGSTVPETSPAPGLFHLVSQWMTRVWLQPIRWRFLSFPNPPKCDEIGWAYVLLCVSFIRQPQAKGPVWLAQGAAVTMACARALFVQWPPTGKSYFYSKINTDTLRNRGVAYSHSKFRIE